MKSMNEVGTGEPGKFAIESGCNRLFHFDGLHWVKYPLPGLYLTR